MTIGQMVRSFLLKLEWYGTLFPRIPVPVQKDLEAKLRSKGLCDDHKRTAQEGWGEAEDFVKRTREDRWVSLSWKLRTNRGLIFSYNTPRFSSLVWLD